jgi:Yersinia/Haemophilus virulence surface antigen
MKYAEALSTLQKLGREVRQYSQADRINANQALKQRVSQGMCAGAVLDWIQMLLCGGSEARKNTPSDLGAMVAALLQAPSQRDAFYDTRKQNLKTAFDQEGNAMNAELEALNKRALKAMEGLNAQRGISQVVYDQTVTRIEELMEKQQIQIKAQHQSKKDQINAALKTESLHLQFWKDFGQTMDSKFKTQAYSKLTIAAGSSSTTYGPPNGLLQFVNKVLTQQAMQAGCAASLGIGPVSAGAGHAVGVHLLNSGNYMFFDPNFGVYVMEYDNLRRAILFLFLKAYPQLEGGNPRDNQPYEVNGKVSGDFVIYKGPAVTAPSVRRMATAV